MNSLNNKFIHFILSIFILASCQDQNNLNSIDLSQNNEISVFDIFSEVIAIQLETSPEALISMISKIEYFNNEYFILDETSQQIFCFDDVGKFKFKISASGNGPGEYNYITDFSIDMFNKQIAVLDPVYQRVLTFDLNGNYISTYSIMAEEIMGYNKVLSINDSILLLTSFSYDQIILYCKNSDSIVYGGFNTNIPKTLIPFNIDRNIYQIDGRTYVMPPLCQTVYDFTDINPSPHFHWCFGLENNTEDQINRLKEEIKHRQRPNEYRFRHEAVGKNKILNHFIINVFETSRFNIAKLEFDNNWKSVIIDKNSQKSYVFTTFKEGVILPFGHFQSDRIVINNFDIPEEIWDKLPSEIAHRSLTTYNLDILTNAGKEIVANHNDITDNPFLVVYKFLD